MAIDIKNTPPPITVSAKVPEKETTELEQTLKTTRAVFDLVHNTLSITNELTKKEN